jgi:hypothetical protein
MHKVILHREDIALPYLIRILSEIPDHFLCCDNYKILTECEILYTMIHVYDR